MQMTFRWFGRNKDTVSLEQIRQIPGVVGVVPALHELPCGEAWPLDMVMDMKKEIEAAGLTMECIESVNVHEDIKLGLPTREKYIENYITSIRNLAKAGVKVICYNFMPVFDWLRTNLYFQHTDGANSLAYSEDDFAKLDPRNLHLPGWDESYSTEQLNELLDKYKDITREALFENLIYFLNGIMPACDAAGVNVAIHPDDPPWAVFGLPRIISTEKDLERLLEAVPNEHNGLTFCTGSLGAGRFNDLVKISARFAKRIYFAHLRQLKYINETDFYENGHQTSSGNIDTYAIVKALVDNGFNGYVRPDHGRNVWGEDAKPGYGLFDRAMGATYLTGLFEAIEKDNAEA